LYVFRHGLVISVFLVHFGVFRLGLVFL